MPSQKKLLCISFNVNQSLLKLLHIGVHDKTSSAGVLASSGGR